MNEPINKDFTTGGTVWLRVVANDGAIFEMPAVPDLDVTQFMLQCKTAGFVGNKQWFVPYVAIMWAGRIEYRPTETLSTHGMVKQ